MPDLSAALAVSGLVGVCLGLVIGFVTGALLFWIVAGAAVCAGATIMLFQPWRKDR